MLVTNILTLSRVAHYKTEYSNYQSGMLYFGSKFLITSTVALLVTVSSLKASTVFPRGYLEHC
jgi:hypothetical protein